MITLRARTQLLRNSALRPSRPALTGSRLTRCFAASKSMEKITFGDDLPGYEIGEKSAPAIIVVQEWWGVNQSIKELAELISKEGFRCLIPDLYKGKLGVDAEEAHHLMSSLDFKAACGEISQAAAYLRSTGSPKVGCTGFCMGGALTFAAMSEGVAIDAGAPFYGIPDAKYFDITKIKGPLLAQFGEKDEHKGFSDPEAARNAEALIKGAGGDIELHIYPSAGHAYMNALVPAGVESMKKVNFPAPDAAELQLSKDRLIAFMKRHLSA